jgi:hypothetical protein
MNLVKVTDIPSRNLPGRSVRSIVGIGTSVIKSDIMTFGVTRFSGDTGIMEPHRHAEEVVYVIKSEGGFFRCGEAQDELIKYPLEDGMIIRFEDMELHSFECEEGGYLDVAFFYATVENIRKEGV